MKFRLLSIFIATIISIPKSIAQQIPQHSWVDSMLSGLSVDEKLGQLFVIRSFANDDSILLQKNMALIRDYHVGGICFFKGTIPVMAGLINQYQLLSRVPLLISMDAEWGIGMRMTDGFDFPKQMTLGAVGDNQWIYKMGREVASQMKMLGIHMNYAPVLDINNNISNPVINERSFGSGRKNVIAKSFAYMQGLQDGGVLACLKHFPGHGDTEVDSHSELPLLGFSRKRLDSVELYPFRTLLNLKPASVMVAHLNIPSLDTTSNLPATLSQAIVTNLLRHEYNYQGLIITDALEMKGVTKNFNTRDIALKAFQAGNDLLLLSEDVPAAILRLKEALVNGEISLSELDEKVRRILQAKFQAGLSDLNNIVVDSIALAQAQLRSYLIRESIYKNAISLVRDQGQLVPLREIPAKIVALHINGIPGSAFQNRVGDYADVCSYTISGVEAIMPQILADLEEADLVLLSLHKLNYNGTKHYGLNKELMDTIRPVLANKKCIVTIFGCPYAVQYVPDNASLLLAYEDNEHVHDLTAQMLFGSDPIAGLSPVNAGEFLAEGQGIFRPSLHRLGYSLPEAQGMNGDTLMKIDSVVYELIQQRAAPGCQVVVAKNNKIVFRKSYGYFTYDSLEPVEDKTLYDLASLTKIICTAPVLMEMDDRNQINLDSRLAQYLPEFETSNKSLITLRDILLHQGKLQAWIPFYKSTLISPDTLNLPDYKYYGKAPSYHYNIPVSDSLYLREDYRDTIYARILDSKLNEENKTAYSDLGFYFLPKLIQQITRHKLDYNFDKHFIKPLGLRNMTFNPLFRQYSKKQIPPTEIDQYFRHRVIQGYVHDMGAAMMGGISGHAGLFSNATDVATVMQMFLNHGNYAGRELITASTISKFTERDRRLKQRGLIFDMPELQDTSTAYISAFASKKTFGHQGFTGTCAWADPEHQLVYVFLSNRTYPDAKINLLHKNRYRMKIQDIIYRSMIAGSELMR